MDELSKQAIADELARERGSMIRAARRAQKMSAKDLGEKIGISEAGLCMIERGDRSGSVAVRIAIARVLSLPATLFLDSDECPTCGQAVNQ